MNSPEYNEYWSYGGPDGPDPGAFEMKHNSEPPHYPGDGTKAPECGEADMSLLNGAHFDKKDLAAKDDSRRLLYFSLGEEEILDLLRSHVDSYSVRWLCSADLKGPPLGSQVLSVHGDCSSRSMLILVTHPSFDVVPAGQEIPVANSLASVEYEFQAICLWPDGSYSTKPPPSGACLGVADGPAISPEKAHVEFSVAKDAKLEFVNKVAREPGAPVRTADALMSGTKMTVAEEWSVTAYNEDGSVGTSTLELKPRPDAVGEPPCPNLAAVGLVDKTFWDDLSEEALKEIENRVKEIRYDRLNSPAKV